MSPSLRWWPSWGWSLHLRSFRCRLLDGSHYTRLTNVRQIESTQTATKPLQTLAFIGVSQPRDGDEKTAGATATATPRHGHVQGCHGHVTTATPKGVTTSRARRPRHGHDGHGAATSRRGHDRIRGTCPRDTTRHAKTQSYKRSNVAPCNKHPRGGASPRVKKPGPLAL